MGLLCSKLCLKSFTSRKKPSTIEIDGNSEKTFHGCKFLRRKMAKKRPVISTPRPANPIFLHGHKWKHVIVTIPTLDDPPIPPVRKKRKQKKLDVVKSASNASGYSAKSAYVEIMSAIQLRRCLRVLPDTGVDWWHPKATVEGKKRGDLFFRILRENETAIMVFALPVNIDYSENRSLTNEQNDSFFDNANVRGYGFKNFILFGARPLKSDLDKLKCCKTCRPAAYQRINEIRAVATLDAKNEKLVFVLRTNITPASVTELCSIDVKNISNKTNQKPNTRSSNANIEKVCDEMKEILDDDATAEQKTTEWEPDVTFGPIPKNQSRQKNDPVQMHHSDGIFISRPINRQRSLANPNTTFSKLHCKYMKNNADSDRDSDCSITDSLDEFSYSL